MQKLQNTRKNNSTKLGALLKRTMSNARADDLGTLMKMHVTTDAPTPQRPAGGLFAPMFATTKASSIAKAALPVPDAMPRQIGTLPAAIPNALIAERQNIAQRFGDPSALSSVLHRETADAHAALIAQIKAIHNAEPGRHPSTGPEALR